MFKSKYMVMAIVLVAVWLGAVVLLHIAAFLLRALLIIAAILFIAHFVTNRKRA